MLSSGTLSPRRVMSQTWSEKVNGGGSGPGLPMPSSSRARPLSLPARVRRRWPLVLVVVCCLLFGLAWVTDGSGSSSSPRTGSSANLGTNVGSAGSGELGYQHEAHAADEEDLMATDDLFVQNMEDTKQRSPEQVKLDEAAEAAAEAQLAEDKKSQLRALIYWIANRGVFPASYTMPSAPELEKMGEQGFIDHLKSIPKSGSKATFGDDWEEGARWRYRVTVFSKSFCPHSKRAKAILSEYPIEPIPFIVELDQRDDMSTVQDMLLYLTGRRTVPNVIIKFASIGGADETRLLHSEGGLKRRLDIVEPHFKDWN